MATKKLDWGNLRFGYMETSKSYVANWKNGEWDEGKLTSDHTVKISECAGVLLSDINWENNSVHLR